jgi:hypothetical protein
VPCVVRAAQFAKLAKSFMQMQKTLESHMAPSNPVAAPRPAGSKGPAAAAPLKVAPPKVALLGAPLGVGKTSTVGVVEEALKQRGYNVVSDQIIRSDPSQ